MSSASPNSPAPQSRFRRLIRSARVKWALVAILAVAVAIWYHSYRGTGWTNSLNPVAWYRRQTGGDLYQADQAYLIRGNHDLPEVALTFDDGPHPASRTDILNTLGRYHVHATFFDVGGNIALHPGLVSKTLLEGHEIANHSYHHVRLDTLSTRELHRELNDTDILYAALTGKHLSLMRPPGMRYNDTVLQETRRLGYIMVGYTSASRDFDTTEAPEVISERTLRHVQNGSILLLHDYPATAAALPAILEALAKRGFRCVTISEMLAHLPERARMAATKASGE